VSPEDIAANIASAKELFELHGHRKEQAARWLRDQTTDPETREAHFASLEDALAALD